MCGTAALAHSSTGLLESQIEIEVWGAGRVHWLVEYSATSMVTLALDYDIDDPKREPTTHLLIKLHLQYIDYDIDDPKREPPTVNR